MKTKHCLFIFVCFWLAGSAAAQIILEPAVTGYVRRAEQTMSGHGHGSNPYYTHQVNWNPGQPDVSVSYRDWTSTWTYYDEWANWHHNRLARGIIEINVQSTAMGGEFPTAAMTSGNFMAILCGLTISEASNEGRNMSCWIGNMKDNMENGQVDSNDYNAEDGMIHRLFSTIPSAGTRFPAIDITDQLRNDLFGTGSGDPTSGFIFIPSPMTTVQGKVVLNHLNPRIEIYLDGQATPTPLVTPSPTPDPDCSFLSPELHLNQTVFHSDDPFLLTCGFCNPGDPRLIDLYILLDVQGMYWFWPGWLQSPDCRQLTAWTGMQSSIMVLDFSWPDISGSASGLFFLAGMIDPETVELIGDIDSVEWGYE